MPKSKTIYLPLGVMQTLLGIAISVLGMTVALGWILQVRVMVEIIPGLVAMVFNAGLCFILVGSALTLPELLRKPLFQWQTFTGVFLLIFGGVTFVEQIFDLSFGVDMAFLHSWINDGNTRPGRMAPNTALGFFLTGTALILMNRVNSKRRALTLQILTFSVMTIGITGIIGYSLGPDLLFGWARSARMALHSASGMIAISISFWIKWQRADWFRSRTYFREDENIGFMSGAILAVITIAAGLMGFVLQHSVLENTLKESLHANFQNRMFLLQTIIQQHAQKGRDAAREPEFVHFAQLLTSQPNVGPRLSEMHKTIAAHFSKNGFQALALYDVSGKTIASMGDMKNTSALEADLQEPIAASLVWDQAFYLRTEAEVIANGVLIARLKTLQALPNMHDEFFNAAQMGRSAEIALCKSVADTLRCFPNIKNAETFTVQRHSANGKALPMSFAVDGRFGMVSGLDYRKQNVIAAFGPIAPGVGVVVKQDTAELYSPIREQLKTMVPSLFLMALLGIIFLRSQLRPLVTRLIASEIKATEKEMEIKAVVDNVGEGIITIDQSGLIQSFNLAATQIFGYSFDEVLGKNIKMIMPPEMRTPHETGMHNYLRGGEPQVIGRQGMELSGLRKDGTLFPLELTVNEIHLDQHRWFVGILRDITARKQTEERMAFLAQFDSLTNLPNRALFMDRLESAVARANRNQASLAVMFLDLDGFKKINDTLGHLCGDDLLKQFGARLKLAVRNTDTVARLGGDEFTIILEGLTDSERDIKIVADKIIDAMQSPFLLAEKNVTLTTSIGIALHHVMVKNPDDLLRRADAAMYHAKNNGKNQWSIESSVPNKTDRL